MQTLPFISVIVPVRNEERYVAACLQSILAGDYPHEFMEILVVDGQSDDRTAEIVRGICARHPAVQLLSNPARVVPHAMNVGIRAARGALIVRIDAPRALRAELSARVGDVDGQAAGGQRRRRVGGAPATRAAQAVAVAAIISHPFGVGAAPYRMRSADAAAIEVDTVPFGCYRREIFDRIGLFDERFIRNQDDEAQLGA
jgi:glycosyltransferase involved in cell wall biosynthesis